MYIVLIASLLFFSTIYYRAESVVLTCNLLHSKKIHFGSFCIFLSVFLFWFMLCFKSINVGIDIPGYKSFYEQSVDAYFIYDRKWGLFDQYLYYFIFKLLKDIGFSFHSTCLLIYTCAFIPIYFLIKKHADNPIQALLIFVCLGAFNMYASAIRQIMAGTLGYLAMQNQMKAKRAREHCISLLLILGAILIHNSAIILFFAWLLSFIFRTKKHILFLGVIGSTFSLFMPVSLIRVISQYIDGDSYEAAFGTSSNILLILVYICIAIVVIWQQNKSTVIMKHEEPILLLYALLSVTFMLLSSKLYILSRLSFFFLLPLCIVFSNSIDRISKERGGKILHLIIVILFLLFFIAALKDDTTDIYPYQFIWQDSKT